MEQLAQPTATRAEIDELADRIAELDAQETVLGRARLTIIRRFDEVSGWGHQGTRSCAHWLSWRLGLDLQTAREQVRVARALGALPKIDAAFERGAVSYSKVRAMTRVATAENEERLLDLAIHSTAEQLVKICRGYSQVVSGTGDEELAPLDERRLFQRRDLQSGLVRLSVQLRPEEAAVVQKAIDVVVERMVKQNSPAEEGAVAERAARRVDAFVGVFESFLATAASSEPSSVPGRHEVVLHVDSHAGIGELPDGSHVGVETIRRLCCDSPIVTVVEDHPEPASGPPRPVAVSRRTRSIATSLRRALEARDEHCRFPGCRNRYWVDAHHIQHWADGGATTLDNLTLLCRRHHRLVHEGGFTVKQTAEGPAFYDPHDRKIEAAPRRPDLGDDALAELEEARREKDIGPETNAPRWDGTRLDLGWAVAALLEDGSRAPADFVDEEDFVMAS